MDKVSQILEPPYLKNLKDEFGIIETEEVTYILSKLYNIDITVSDGYGTLLIYFNDLEIYGENTYIYQNRFYDDNKNLIYVNITSIFDNKIYWEKREYDDDNRLKYYEDSKGLKEKYR